MYTSPRMLCILGFVCAYILGLLTFAPQASAATLSGPGGDVANPVVRQVDIARPAVVRIITTLPGKLTVQFSSTVSATFPTSGGSYPLELSGTGAFISAHGDILTADHVINPPHDQDLDSGLYYYAAQDVADYINAHFQVSAPYTASDAYNVLVNGSLPSTASYGQASSEVYLSTSYAGPLNVTKIDALPISDHATVDRIEAQSSFNADDVAIVHVSGMDNMPSIQLGDSSQVAEQDNLTIIGYPGLGDLSMAPTNLLTSSLNRVYVSALKTTDGGAPVIQIGGNVEHGDSGGPALDSNGNIVGIVSFTYSGTNGDYGETTFLQTSNSAQALIKSLGLDTAPGSFETAWAQAVDDYSSTSAGHWHKAAQELQNLAHADPNFVGLAPFLTYAQNQASHEQPVSGGIDLSWLLIALLVAVLIVLGILFFVILRRNTHPAVATPGATQYPSSGMYGMYPQQPGGYPPTPGAYAQSSGIYPPTYGVAAPTYAQPGIGVQQQSAQSGVVYPNYTSPAAYGAQPEQIPQTPPLAPDSFPQSPLPQTPEPEAAFSQPSVQTPLPSWAPPVQVVNPTPVVQSTQGISEPEIVSDAPVAPVGEQSEPVGAAAQAVRSFSVPRRPVVSEAILPETPEVAASTYTWVAPCGHSNPANVRFCHVCGQRVTGSDA